ncbi:MAG: hypothetical protein AB7E49_10075 [Campylobacterales bacterium]
MVDWNALDEQLGLRAIFNGQLNDPAYLRQSFSTRAIEEMRQVTHDFYDRILADTRLKPFHGPIASPQRRIRFEKNLARFCLYVLVMDYRQILTYFVRAMGIHKRLNIPFELVYEYFLYLSARFEPWAIVHFKLDLKDQLFYRRKMDSLAFLFLKSYDDRFLASLEEQLDQPISGASPKTQAIEIAVFALLEEELTPASFEELLAGLKRYGAHVNLLNQRGCEKISTVILRFESLLAHARHNLLAMPGSRALIADFMEKCALYTADPEFSQASLALYYLDLQIEMTMFRVFTGLKAPAEAS